MRLTVRDLFLSILLINIAINISAHPDDEFCSQDMDPLLCRELAALDSNAFEGGQRIRTSPKELSRAAGESFVLYFKLGVVHILPDGWDHLLFILALLLSTARVKQLVLQVTLFTFAHSFTLALALFGLVSLSSQWVEALIALSITFVALENILIKPSMLWRLPIIFIFGLLHGLGFAGALQGMGMPDGHFIPALAGFNSGIEVAQIGFALSIFCIVRYAFAKPRYEKRVLYPMSVLIATVSLFWFIERLIS